MFCIFQAAIQTERLKALEWMERHNREKENLRDLQVFLTVTRKLPVNSNGRMERLMCKLHLMGYYCSLNLSSHQNLGIF